MPVYLRFQGLRSQVIRSTQFGPEAAYSASWYHEVHLTGEDPKCGTLDATTGSGWQGMVKILTFDKS